MKQNMGGTDKLVRTLTAVTIGVLYLTNTISGIIAIVLLILAGIFMMTSIVGFCPLYFPFGISTKGNTTEEYFD